MIKIWTDGACFPNPGKGGWAWTDLDGKENSGSEPRTTNQRMEILAVIDALEKNTGPVEIISDSQYVIKGATIWSKAWIRNGWKNARGQLVKNRKLWEQLLKTMVGRRVAFTWVKGHSEDPGNDRADELATSASGAGKGIIDECTKRWH